MPEISVIIPVYKVEKYLDRCIKSVLESTFYDIEIILVDDGSPDNCPDICDNWAKIDDRIRVIHQKNGGLSAARNAGIKLSTGAYITFIDSDDWISPEMLEILYNISKVNDADIVFCDFVRTREYILKKYKKNSIIKVYCQDDILKILLKINSNRCIHYACGKLYKANIIDRGEHFPVGLFNEDVEGMFKATLNSKIIVESNYKGYYYYINNASITGTVFGENYLSLTKVWDRVVKIIRNKAPKYLEQALYNRKRINFTILCDSIIHGNEKTDSKYYIQEKRILDELKHNYKYLIKGDMALNRKIFMTLLLSNYSMIKSVLRYILECNMVKNICEYKRIG